MLQQTNGRFLGIKMHLAGLEWCKNCILKLASHSSISEVSRLSITRCPLPFISHPFIVVVVVSSGCWCCFDLPYGAGRIFRMFPTELDALRVILIFLTQIPFRRFK